MDTRTLPRWPLLLLLLAGCALVRSRGIVPQQHELVCQQLVVHSDFVLERENPLIEQLVAQRERVSRSLRLPVSDEPIHVYLFQTPHAYQAFLDLHYPDFPSRRAFFVKTDERLLVFAHWSDRVAEDLRHEVAHGYLHASAGALPLWLDEGLAEYFEVPEGKQGRNQAHITALLDAHRQGTWKADLAALESITSVREMTQQQYAESWLWVHFLLETEPSRRQLLAGHLEELRNGDNTAALLPRLNSAEARPHATVLEHLLSLKSSL